MNKGMMCGSCRIVKEAVAAPRVGEGVEVARHQRHDEVQAAIDLSRVEQREMCG
jgi:hypothetical protein